MQNRWLTVILMALTVKSAMCAAAAPTAAAAPGAIDDCIAQVDSEVASGLEFIATQCPDLMRRLQSSDWAAWLPVGWKVGYYDRQAGWQGGYNYFSTRTLA